MPLSTRSKLRLALQAVACEYQSQLAKQKAAKVIAEAKDDVSKATWVANFTPSRENLLSGASIILKAQAKTVTPMWIKAGVCLGLAIVIANSPAALNALQSALQSASKSAASSQNVPQPLKGNTPSPQTPPVEPQKP
jgi:hypothetical protein